MGNKRRRKGNSSHEGIIAQDDIIVTENKDFRMHLRKLVNRTDCSDLDIICMDGVHVRAIRMFLVGRSSWFNTMLTNGMRESKSSVIHLRTISSGALLSILEFLYTGNLVDYQPKDWRMAFEVISVADFLLVQGVEKIVREYLWTQISDWTEEPHRAATMLTAALEYNCVHHDEETALLRLVHVLGQNWVHEECVSNLSEGAVDFILRQTKPKMENRLELSLDEYFRFRAVLLWCLSNSHFISREEALKLVNQAVPLTTDELYRKGAMESSRTKTVAVNDKDSTQDTILGFFVSHPDYKQSAMRLLTRVDWVRIPPRLFTRIVEPLKLVSDSQLLDIFRLHTLHRQMSM